MAKKRTLEGLPVVSEEAFMEFLREYDLTNPRNNPSVTHRIEQENPQIYRILKLGMKGTESKMGRSYYECGIQICYELLRKQSNILKNSRE